MKNILRKLFSTLIIAAVLSTGGYAVSAEVNPGVLKKVQYYYKINLEKGRGCNWYQVLAAFDHEPATNPLNCSTVPYTAEQASNKPWSGWDEVRDELKRLEDLAVEQQPKPQQDSFDSWVQADNDRQGGPGAVAPAEHDPNPDDLPVIGIEGCTVQGLGVTNYKTTFIEGDNITCDLRSSQSKNKTIDVNYKVENLRGSYLNETPDRRGFIQGKERSSTAYGWQLNINSVVSVRAQTEIKTNSNSGGKVRVSILPGEGYVIEQPGYIDFNVISRWIRMSSAGCAGIDAKTGHANESDEVMTCYFEKNPEWQPNSDVTVNYSIKRSGDNSNVFKTTTLNSKGEIIGEGSTIDTAGVSGTFKFPKNRPVVGVPVAVWADNDIYEDSSEITFTLTGGNYTIGIEGRNEATATVKDDDISSVWINFCSYLAKDFGEPITSVMESEAGEIACQISSSTPGYPDINRPMKVKITSSGFNRDFRNAVIAKQLGNGLNNEYMATGKTTALTQIFWEEDEINYGDSIVTVEILPGDGYKVLSHKSSFSFKFIDDDSDPHDIKIGLMQSNGCKTDIPLVVNEDSTTELCLETNGYSEYTYLDLTLDQDEGGFIDSNNNPKMIKVPPATNSTSKHITRGIYVPVRPNNDHGRDGSIRITLEGSVDGQYNPISKKAVVKNVRSGGSGNQIFIKYQSDPTVKQSEHDLRFKVYPPHDFEKPLKILAMYEGYRRYTTQEFNINKRGQEITLEVDKGDQVDRPLDITFSVVGNAYKVVNSDREITIAVKDTDPTCFRFTPNSLGVTLEEYSFTKIASWRIDSKCDDASHTENLVNDPEFSLKVEWGLSGCTIVDRFTNRNDPDGPLECFLDMPGFERDPHKINIFRQNGSFNGRFTMKLQGGTDADTDDERIRFDPKFIVNSSGEIQVKEAPKYLTAYDDDIPTRPLTSTPLYLELNPAVTNPIGIEGEGPIEIGLIGYYLDKGGNKKTEGLIEVCDPNGYCKKEPVIRNKARVQIKVENITAEVGQDYHLGSQKSSNTVAEAVYAGGLVIAPPNGRQPFNEIVAIRTIADEKKEGTETFRVSIIEETLPNGFYLKDGDQHSVVAQIIDKDPKNGNYIQNCGSLSEEECPLKIVVSIDSNSIDESVIVETPEDYWKATLNLTFNITSNRDITSSRQLDVSIEDTIGNLIGDTPYATAMSSSSTTAGVPRSRNIPIRWTDYQSYTGFEHRQIKLKLTGPEAIEGNELLIWITNNRVANVEVKTPSDAPTDWKAEPSDNNKFIIGIADDTLNEQQILQVPIAVNDSSNDPLPIDHYELELDHTDDNIRLDRKHSGKYILTIKGHTNKTYSCGGDTLNSSGQACLRFINKKVMTDNDNEYTVKITLDGSNFDITDYGITRGLKYQKDPNAEFFTKVVKPVSLVGTGKTIRIEDMAGLSEDPANAGYLLVNEPPSGVNKYRFDVVIDPPPSVQDNGNSRVTDFKFCVVQSGKYTYEREAKSTYADYYSDFRITGLGGGTGIGDTRAFNKDTGCTHGERMNTERNEYFLWVHRDAWEDTDEKIHLYLVLGNNPDNITTVEHNSPSNSFKYIIKNDGSLVEDYLKVSGHAKASYIADIVKRRVTGPADREVGITIIPGGSPGDTDPAVILEAGTYEATNDKGISFYLDVSKLSFSGTGENNVSSDIRVITLGADKRWDSFLVGSGFSVFNGGGEWDGGSIKDKSWALFPYAAYYSGRLTVYGSLSFGEGSIVLSPNKMDPTDPYDPDDLTADTKWRAYIIGADYILVNTDKLTVSLFGDYFDQETKTKNSVGTPDTSASTYRLRAGIESLYRMENSDLRLSVSYDKDTWSDGHLGLGMGLSMRFSEQLSAEINYSKSGEYSSVGVTGAYQINDVWRAGAHVNDNDIGAELQGNLSF